MVEDERPNLRYATAEDFYERDQRGEILLSSREHAWKDVTVSRTRHRLREFLAVIENHAVLLNLKPTSVSGRYNGLAVKHDIQTGDMMIAPAGGLVDMKLDGRLNDDINVIITPTFLQNVALNCDLNPDKVELVPQIGCRDRRAVHLFLAFLAELENDNLGGRLVADSLAQQLAVHLLRQHSTFAPQQLREHKGGLLPYRLRRVIEYIAENLGDDLTLEDMASVAGLNVYHFARVFKQSTGEPPHQYVINRRIERARVLLSDRELSLMEVCLRVGFQSQNHFTTLFRKRTGLTPKAYRDSL